MKDGSTGIGDIIGSETLQIIAGADKFNRWMYEEIRSFLKGEILEIGSGTGNISKYVLEDGFTTTLSDYNPDYINYLQGKFAGYANCRAILSLDLQDPDFEKNNSSLREKFDTVFLLNVIEHLQDDLTAVAYCKWMLKPNGHLILLAPAYSFLYCDLDKNLGHYRRYTINTLAALLTDKSFMIIRKKYFNLAGIAGWLIKGKIFRIKQVSRGSIHFFNMITPVIRFADRLVFKKSGLSVIIAGKKQ